ncbi:MAG: hypothetical protein U1E65_12610 [Myxococcota bacterium]
MHELSILENSLIESITGRNMAISEGKVMTVGPAPYRRLDCDGRALAYVRTRPRKNAIRVDISGLWVPERTSPIREATATGSATLFIRSVADLEEAVRFLADTVENTRRLNRTRANRVRF